MKYQFAQSLLSFLLLLTLANGQFGQCDRGSDDLCARFQPGYCCAYVNIQSSEDQMTGYWCASKQYTGEKYDFDGYKGSIICSWAMQSGPVLGATALVVAALIL